MKNGFTIILIAVAVLGGGYYLLTKEKDDGSTLITTTSGGVLLNDNSSDDNARAARISSLLNQVRSLSLDTTLFESAVFNSLDDYSVDIPAQNVGRYNPFEPASSRNPTATSSSSSRTN